MKFRIIDKLVDITEKLVEKYPKNEVIWKINRIVFSKWVDMGGIWY